MILCITGGIACGKSETGRILAGKGFEILDTDEAVHDLMKPGQKVYAAVVDHFGTEIVNADKTLNRRKLGRLVFKDDHKRKLLESLTHPAVIERCRKWIDRLRRERRDGAVLIPLYFEAGIQLDVDAVVCISADMETMLRRLSERGFDEVEARRRIKAQMPVSEKEQRSDHTVMNNGSLTELKTGIEELLNRLT